MSKLTFAYWSIRGRGQQLRFLLEYVEADYEEKTYPYGPDHDKEWFEKDKKVLKPFPNLPSIIDNGFYLTEHDTLITYIVRRHPKYLSLLGINQGENDEFRISQLINFLNDVRASLREMYFNKNYSPEVVETALSNLLPRLNQILEVKGNNPFLLPYLTVVDFKFVEALLYIKSASQEFFTKHLSSLEDYIISFYKLPRISEYVRTPQYQKLTEFFFGHKVVNSGEKFLNEFNKQFLPE